MKYDSIIILPHESDRNGNLLEESLLRSNLAIDLFNNGYSKSILTLGWDYRKDSDITLSKSFKNHLISSGIPENVIIEDNNSRDTVGDAFFSKIVLGKKKYHNLIVVTSDWHSKRAKIIFDLIYRDKFKLTFKDVKSTCSLNRIKKENESLNKFYSTFNPMPLNDEEILKIMIEKHPFYNGQVYKKIDF
ncbi:MAG: YdcF family protein [Flavobacteriaceae bacterium]|jgi:hypothetical protein|nr:YdcF family protein [Flavobacteriaceae bacterium]